MSVGQHFNWLHYRPSNVGPTTWMVFFSSFPSGTEGSDLRISTLFIGPILRAHAQNFQVRKHMDTFNSHLSYKNYLILFELIKKKIHLLTVFFLNNFNREKKNLRVSVFCLMRWILEQLRISSYIMTKKTFVFSNNSSTYDTCLSWYLD